MKVSAGDVDGAVADAQRVTASQPDVGTYHDTLGLLGVEDALRICEEVYGMHARGSVVLSSPPSFKLDVAQEFQNHWHVKSVLLKEVPTTGVRLYNYYDDGVRNTVGDLGCTRYIVLSDPHSGEPVAIVDEHWSYAIRSTAAGSRRMTMTTDNAMPGLSLR